jgi:hypothetical protein
VHDVDCVRERRHCSVLNACGYLTDGEFSETLQVALSKIYYGRVVLLGKREVVWGRWKGMKIETLERKYHLEKAAQKSPKNRPD